MKSILRRILFVNSYLYHYPYSLLNLDNDLDRIYRTRYFNYNTILRGKKVSENQFSLWEKWNIYHGYNSFDALSFFSGTIYDDQNKTYIIGTIYPNPIIVIVFYFIIFILTLILYKNKITEFLGLFVSFGIISILLLVIILYFRRRVRSTVEYELQLEKNN